MIKDALQSASIRLVGRKPVTFFGAPQSGVFEMEMTDLVNEVATDVCKYQDWQALTRTTMLTGNGSDASFDLPTDYDRQLLNTDVQAPVNWLWGYTHITNINDFLFEENRGLSYQPGGWIIYGDQMRFTPTPSGEAQFPYVSKNYALSAASEAKPAFDDDTDTFLLPERLLTLGLVWRWRENKKLDASGDQEAFIKALDEYAAKDRGSSIIRFTGRRRLGNTSVPYMGVGV